jgi:hypothetical protein
MRVRNEVCEIRLTEDNARASMQRDYAMAAAAAKDFAPLVTRAERLKAILNAEPNSCGRRRSL